MSITVPMESAGQDLREMVEHLPAGETITLVRADGKPLAVLVSLGGSSEQENPERDWLAELRALAADVTRMWQGPEGAVETLIEMRR